MTRALPLFRRVRSSLLVTGALFGFALPAVTLAQSSASGIATGFCCMSTGNLCWYGFTDYQDCATYDADGNGTADGKIFDDTSLDHCNEACGLSYDFAYCTNQPQVAAGTEAPVCKPRTQIPGGAPAHQPGFFLPSACELACSVVGCDDCYYCNYSAYFNMPCTQSFCEKNPRCTAIPYLDEFGNPDPQGFPTETGLYIYDYVSCEPTNPSQCTGSSSSHSAYSSYASSYSRSSYSSYASSYAASSYYASYASSYRSSYSAYSSSYSSYSHSSYSSWYSSYSHSSYSSSYSSYSHSSYSSSYSSYSRSSSSMSADIYVCCNARTGVLQMAVTDPNYSLGIYSGVAQIDSAGLLNCMAAPLNATSRFDLSHVPEIPELQKFASRCRAPRSAGNDASEGRIDYPDFQPTSKPGGPYTPPASKSAASRSSSSAPLPFVCSRYIPSSPACYVLTPSTNLSNSTLFLDHTQAQCSGKCPDLQNLVACCDPTVGCAPLDYQRCTGNGFASVTYPAGGLGQCNAIWTAVGC